MNQENSPISENQNEMPEAANIENATTEQTAMEANLTENEALTEKTEDIAVVESTENENLSTTLEEASAENKIEAPIAQKQEVENKKAEVAFQEEDDDHSDIEEEGYTDRPNIHQEEAHAEIVEYDTMSKSELLHSLHSIVNEGNPLTAKTRFIKVRNLLRATFNLEKEQDEKRFIEEGNKPDDFQPTFDPLYAKFEELIQNFKRRATAEKDKIEADKNNNLVKKKEVLDQIRDLVEAENAHSRFNELKELNEAFKQIGNVPFAANHELWDTYNILNEKFYDNYKINRELIELDMTKNLEAKVALCEQAEELLAETSISKSLNIMAELHKQWKEIGPVFREHKDTIWERFISISNKVYERKDEYFKKREEEQLNNLAQKENIIQLAERIAVLTPHKGSEWKENTEAMDQLFVAWKTIGPVPQKLSDDIWKQFNQVRKAYFNNKFTYFKNLRNDFNQNLSIKKELVLRAEALQASTNWAETSRELIDLQNQWKKVGPVPRKDSDELWKAFRASCNVFFDAKKYYYDNLDSIRTENLDKKKALIETISNHVMTGNQDTDIEALKKYQKEWLFIGEVPRDDKNNVQDLYRKTLDEQFDKLKMSRDDKKKVQFQSRISNIMESTDANSNLRREEQNIRHKMDALTAEIGVLENNIGFFSNSKNSETFRKEIDKKVRLAKIEIEDLNVKLKLLKQAKDTN